MIMDRGTTSGSHGSTRISVISTMGQRVPRLVFRPKCYFGWQDGLKGERLATLCPSGGSPGARRLTAMIPTIRLRFRRAFSFSCAAAEVRHHALRAAAGSDGQRNFHPDDRMRSVRLGGSRTPTGYLT